MIICLSEFGVKPGMEQRNIETVTELMKEVAKIDGFMGKETYTGRNDPGKIMTVSYWRDADALRAWMRNKEHLDGMKLGKAEIYSHYTIRIAELQRERTWTRP